MWSILLILTLFNCQHFALNKGLLGKETHIRNAGVKHVPDSFAHFEQELTCSLHLVGVLLQIWEHMTQQGIKVGNLCDTRRPHFVTEVQKKEGTTFRFGIRSQANNSPSSSKKRSSLLRTCGCALSCVPTVCCINCGEKRSVHFHQVGKTDLPVKPPQSLTPILFLTCRYCSCPLPWASTGTYRGRRGKWKPTPGVLCPWCPAVRWSEWRSRGSGGRSPSAGLWPAAPPGWGGAKERETPLELHFS